MDLTPYRRPYKVLLLTCVVNCTAGLFNFELRRYLCYLIIGQGVRNDDGNYTFPPENIQVTEGQRDLTIMNVMVLSNATISVDEVQLYIYAESENKSGSLVSLLPNSAGVFEARVNPIVVGNFELEEADILMKSEVNVTSTGQVQVSTEFTLRLSKTTLGGNAIVVHKLVFVVTSHDKNKTEHRHDQHYYLNYTKTQGKYPP